MNNLKKKEIANFNIAFDNERYMFSNKEIPIKNLSENGKKYFKCFVNDLNREIKDERNDLIDRDDSCCEKCICWTCAFTIIGTIPFCCWFCKGKDFIKDTKASIEKKITNVMNKYKLRVNETEICIQLITKENQNEVNEDTFYYIFNVILYNRDFQCDLKDLNDIYEDEDIVLPVLSEHINNNSNTDDKNTLRIVDYNQVYENNQETNRNNANLDCQYQFGNNQIYFQPNNQNGYQQYPMNNNNMNQVVEMGFVNNQMGNYYMNQH